MHLVLIVVHAVLGGCALVVGLIALRHRTVFPIYEAALVVSLLTLTVAVVVHWPTLGSVERVVFAGILVLAVVMVGQAERARQARSRGTEPRGYAAAIGFTLIALFDAFLVIAVLDVGGPGWVVVAVGLVTALVGHLVLKRRLSSLSDAGPARLGDIRGPEMRT